MQIDWFTLIAQAVNFLVLVWLLKRFLYGRIVDAMNSREAKIASRLEEAAQQRAKAEQEAELYRARNRELEEQREQFLGRARDEAEGVRQELLLAARREAEKVQAEWYEALQREQTALLPEVRERMGQQVFTIARQALRDLANADLEQQVLMAFLGRLRGLDPAEREALVAVVRETDREVEVRSAFPVAAEMRERVARALREHLDDTIDVRFTTAPELRCGIELRAHSHRLVWNLESYLDGLEESVLEALEQRTGENAEPPQANAGRPLAGHATGGR